MTDLWSSYEHTPQRGYTDTASGATPWYEADRALAISRNGASVFDAVADQVRDRIRRANLLTAAQMDGPTQEEMETVGRLALEVIEGYNQTAASQGLPRLVGEPASLARRVVDDILGWGPLAPFMSDDRVEEIIVNGPDAIFVIYAGGRKERAQEAFRDADALRNFLNRKIEAGSGYPITPKNPHQDARLSDGSRLFVALPPIVANIEAPVATIRRFRPVARDLEALIQLGTITVSIANFLKAAVQTKLNVAIAGGTSTGKTTFLQSLTSAMPEMDRVVTVEDTPELNLAHAQDWVQLITRKASEGVTPITMRDLVKDTLRMRPDRIILGEARGGEMVDILVAMNTGHDGVMFTVHANDVHDTFERIETMYLMGQDLSLTVVRRQIVNAVDLIVHLIRDARTDRRFVSGIGEVRRLEMAQPVIETIFEYDPAAGCAVYADIIPACRERLEGAAPGFDFRRDVIECDRHNRRASL
jgi:pilus assembly protein CpaF